MQWMRYTENARRVMLHAEDWAFRLSAPYISTEHILLGLLEERDNTACQILQKLGVDISRLSAELESELRERTPKRPPLSQPMLTSSAKQVLIKAADEAISMGEYHIDTSHLLLGLFWERQGLAVKFLTRFGVRYEDVRQHLPGLKEKETAPELEQFAEDWTKKAAAGEFRPVNFWQRERVQFVVALMRKERPNLLLVGNFEISTLLVQQLACELLQRTSQSSARLMPNRLLRLKWGTLRSSEMTQEFLTKVSLLKPKPILFVGTTEEIAQMPNSLITIVRQGELPIIAIATSEQWDEFQRRFPSLAATFAVIFVSEPDETQTLEWLKVHAEVYALFHEVTVDESALPAIVQLVKKHFAEKPLLPMAKNLLDEVCAFSKTYLAQTMVNGEAVKKFSEFLFGPSN
ncbi:MAG: Clp protease N-terminal domain-containing protein [Armatimonadota bacterium]